MNRASFFAFPVLAVLAGPAACPPANRAIPVPIDAHNVARHVRVLSADEMEGRGVGTKGLDAAADYIAEQMKAAGLEPGGVADGEKTTWFQPLEMTTGVVLGTDNAVELGSAALAPVKIDEGWRPLELSESGLVAAEIVFAGYGITAPELSWDDYADVDVKGKIVLVLRHEPGEKDPHSTFNGTELTRYSEIRVKAINARVHGAVGMILVNDVAAHDGTDELLKLGVSGEAAAAGLVAIHATRKTVDAALAGASIERAERARSGSATGGGTPTERGSIAALEKQIGDSGKPASQPLAPARASLKVDLKKTKKPVKNVVGFLRGYDRSLTSEAIVIGAHYDHLGMGNSDSLDPNNVGQPHNGADDNASGTSALLSIASSFGSGPRPKRSLIFIAFTAEESGLGGSSFYVNHPTWPIEKTLAMLNMDMVGRMRDKKVVVFGAATGKEFGDLLTAANVEKLAVTATGDGYGPSDQTVFYAKNIPVLHFFTGAHADYHRTTDDAGKIDSEGLAQVARLVRRVAVDLADRDLRVSFVPSGQIAHAQGQTGGTGGYGAYFGSVPDFTESPDPGVVITGTRAGSPAEKAGLTAGDRLVKFGEVDVKNLYDLTFALRKYKPGDDVQVSYVREGATKSVAVKLGKRGD